MLAGWSLEWELRALLGEDTFETLTVYIKIVMLTSWCRGVWDISTQCAYDPPLRQWKDPTVIRAACSGYIACSQAPMGGEKPATNLWGLISGTNG
jgi:hypothetical protein